MNLNTDTRGSKVCSASARLVWRAHLRLPRY